ncbi:mediator of RNA polymerase II transcription subunit 26 [Gadus macrocephalus]|uniref:mediator of RNA polymerase II transcription subunit 26 n=1 Tax=Gadus macrocephalus TaxID=80720 RepID=UPI0028CBB88C|nr:mediator of RNA polymerase II transcription subunit 26 [Gadus macrocephalus]
MTTVSATPQQMRDRLLKAVDSHSNICNMVAVLEVITYLEKYPITKEALEETRLGKLINDVRKKTNNEDLAKRAKKLLRNWQKLIDPGPAETPTRGPGAPPASTNGGLHPCRTDAPSAAAPPDVLVEGKGVPDVKVRNDVHNTYSPKAAKSSNRKRRAEQRDGVVHLPEKISRMAYEHSLSPPLTNGTASSPEALLEQEVVPSPDRPPRTDHLDNDKHNKIPVNAVKPRPSSPGVAKLPSTSSLIKVAVMQQQVRMEDGGCGVGGAGGGGYYQAKSPRGVTTSPRGVKETMTKRSSAYAPKGVPSPTPRGSPLPSSQPAASLAQSPLGNRLPHPSYRSSAQWASTSQSSSSSQCPPHDSFITLESPSISPRPSQHSPTQLRPSAEATASIVVAEETDGPPLTPSERKRRKKYRSRDYAVNLDGQKTEDTVKPVRLKERRITFDPVTGQIKSMVHKEPFQTEEAGVPDSAECTKRTENIVPQTPVPPSAPTFGPAAAPPFASAPPVNPAPAPNPNPFQQTNWKELSRNEIIQSYLNLQSNMLTSSGVQTPSAHFFMSEYLKREEPGVKEAREMHVLQKDSSVAHRPGVSGEVTDTELDRIHTQHWPGVNGCYDTKGAWFDWTECISLDPHGGESRLNILPYVCLD